jgi:hypothetical protein
MKVMLHFGTVLLLVGLAGELSAVGADKEKAKPYPLDKCLVTDEKLDDHGKPYVFTHQGQEIKLCCKDCLGDFKKEPAKYLGKLKEGDKEKK